MENMAQYDSQSSSSSILQLLSLTYLSCPNLNPGPINHSGACPQTLELWFILTLITPLFIPQAPKLVNSFNISVSVDSHYIVSSGYRGRATRHDDGRRGQRSLLCNTSRCQDWHTRRESCPYSAQVLCRRCIEESYPTRPALGPPLRTRLALAMLRLGLCSGPLLGILVSPPSLTPWRLLTSFRTRCFIFHRLKSTARENGLSGTTRSPPPRACESLSASLSISPRSLTWSSYGLSVLALRASPLPLNLACSAFNLRSVNVWCATLIAFTAGLCRCQIELNQTPSAGSSRTKLVSAYPIHTGFNIALFPVLFFFSALYYTDVMSTLAVLAAYSNHLDRVSRPRSSALSDIRTLALGIFALFMRQTNVFWVVVYMGGLEAVHAAKTAAANLPKHRIADSTTTAIWHYLFNSSLGDVHDPPVSTAWPDGKRRPGNIDGPRRMR